MAVRVRRRITGPVAVVVIAVCAVFAARDHGADGVLSAVVGGVVVVLFLGSTRAVLGPMVTALPHASMATSLLFYLTKVAALLALFVVLQDAAGDEGPLVRSIVGGTVIATTLVWLATRTFDEARARIPIFDLPDDPDSAPDKLGE